MSEVDEKLAQENAFLDAAIDRSMKVLKSVSQRKAFIKRGREGENDILMEIVFGEDEQSIFEFFDDDADLVDSFFERVMLEVKEKKSSQSPHGPTPK